MEQTTLLELRLEICKTNKLSQATVAEACGVNPMTYSRAERMNPIRNMTKAKIAAYWKLPINSIIWIK